ncbi:MAG TPA: aminotransferase class III-fold pyridoxal phosphate-dependent enzyme [Streptosporangiaceae bacterium]|nr:aminotransferase class III-fold pyridoxal phosphate-dependent enzyme [Streptosporangiaceae bacterium]
MPAEPLPSVQEILAARSGEELELNDRYLNPQIGRILRTLGFDKVWAGGEGAHLIDADGERYLDLFGGYGVFAIGRNHPEAIAAIEQVMVARTGNMPQLGVTLLSGVLAEQLLARAPASVAAMVPANTGTEAVEAAIKISRAATRRSRILYAEHAFHGLTLGSLSLNGGAEFREGFGPLLPDCDPVAFGDLDALERELARGDVAAFIVEPIQGKGVYCATPEYWRAAQQLCRRHGTLLVTDEVQTGLGRSGRFFCHEHWGLEPDIITVSKALSGGYVPIGAMLTTENIFASVYDSMEDALKHSTTFGRNQLAMVAGLATLTAFDDEDIVGRAESTGADLQDKLRGLMEKYDLIQDIRGLGLMVGIEFGEPEGGSSGRRFRRLERLRTGMFSQTVVVPLFHRHRIITQVAADNVNIIKLLPPLIAGPEEVDYFVQALDDVMADAHRGSGLTLEFGRTMARGAMRRKSERSIASPHPVLGPAADAGQRTGARLPARAATLDGVRGRPAGPALAAPAAAAPAPAGADAGYMPAVAPIEPGDRVVITGAAGFIGSAVTRAVLAKGARVVAVTEPGGNDANLRGLDVERALLDIRDAGAVRSAVAGARYVFHLAAIYRLWARDPRIFHEVNVGGTLNVIDAVLAAGAERLVYTSTVGVLGLDGTGKGRLADETSYADVGHLFGSYKRTKFAAEHEVLRAAGQGLNVTIAMPTFPLGPGDLAPTPTGKVVVDFLNGKMPGFVDTALNVCHVDDLARGHVAALEHGRQGRSYILGGENMTMRELLQALADCSGLPMPRIRVPRQVVVAAGLASSFVEGQLLHREPHVPLEGARMATTKMVFSDDRARAEIGHKSRPARLAIEDSARWFTDNGYVSASRLAAIRWQR